MKVTDPNGAVWTVGRHWLPRYEGRGLRERLRQRHDRVADRRKNDDGRWLDWLDLAVIDDSLSALVVSVVVVGLLVLLVIFGLPLVLAIVDVVVVVGAALLGVAGRILLGRPWTIEARSATGKSHETKVVGWRAASQAVRSIAREIENGREEPEGA